MMFKMMMMMMMMIGQENNLRGGHNSSAAECISGVTGLLRPQSTTQSDGKATSEQLTLFHKILMAHISSILH